VSVMGSHETRLRWDFCTIFYRNPQR